MIRVVRLGSKRAPGEGLRLGTVRRPPRGVPKSRHASEDWYDVWLPDLAPAAKTVAMALGSETAADWGKFARQYRKEMARPEAGRLLDLLAALSKETDFSVGCYCEDETRCHRSLLKQLLKQRGAKVA
jgi:uncharacterized protein YeaO (DUF488 family)